MQRTGRIMIVPQDQLESFPVAVKEYVTHYFEEQKVFGRPCLVAFGALSLGQVYRKGVAPVHSVDLMRFKEGLDGNSLSEWMDEAAEQGLIWKYTGSWDDGCIGPIND